MTPKGVISTFRTLDLNNAAQVIKADPGQIIGYDLANVAAGVRYVKFYDKAAANVNAGSDVPLMTLALQANSSRSECFPDGIRCNTAISVRATTGNGDTNTTGPTTNDVVANVFYG